MTTSLQHTAVVGAGAVGSFFGAMLSRAGHSVTLIGRTAHVDAITRSGLALHMNGQVETLHIAATTDLGAVADADLVLFCVKSTDTDAVARQIAPMLKPGTMLLSLQNGVDNAATMARHIEQTIFPAVVYVATAMPEPGLIKHFGRGDLVIGPLDPAAADQPGQQLQMREVVELFAAAGVPVEVVPDVLDELWRKLLVNCAYNAISAVSQLPYGRMLALPEIREVMKTVVREVVAVAQADGRRLGFDSAMAAVDRIGAAMPAQLSSTAQDLARGKPSEIDHLNGYIVRRGGQLGVPTPVNQTLSALVKLAESRTVNA